MHRPFRMWLWIVAGFLPAAWLWAQVVPDTSPNPGEAAYRRGLGLLESARANPAVALDLQAQADHCFAIGAELGNGPAMFNHALALSNPARTNSVNWDDVVHWYERAASNQVPEAAFNRALLFLQPPAGQKVDAAAAVRWLDLAATNGLVSAQTLLGRLHAEGRGVTASDELAAYWFRTAARQGDPEAVFGLSRLLRSARVRPQSGEDAEAMLRSAAQGGVPEGQELLARSWEERLGPDAQAEATRWYRAAAENGQPLAQWQLGQRLQQGLGAATHVTDGVAWMLVASESLHRDVTQELREIERNLQASQWAEIRERAEILRRQIAQQAATRRQNAAQPVSVGPTAGPSTDAGAARKPRVRRLADLERPTDDSPPGLPPESYRNALTAAVNGHWDDLVRTESRKLPADPEFAIGHATVTYRLHSDGRLSDIRFEPGSTGGTFQVLLSEALALTSPFTPWNNAVRRAVGNDYVDLVQKFAREPGPR